MNMKELLRKLEELGCKEREYLEDVKDEYLYYRDDFEDLVVSRLGVHGEIIT
jgi:hypothetical protein